MGDPGWQAAGTLQRADDGAGQPGTGARQSVTSPSAEPGASPNATLQGEPGRTKVWNPSTGVRETRRTDPLNVSAAGTRSEEGKMPTPNSQAFPPKNGLITRRCVRGACAVWRVNPNSRLDPH